jgi:hypothetical protein
VITHEAGRSVPGHPSWDTTPSHGDYRIYLYTIQSNLDSTHCPALVPGTEPEGLHVWQRFRLHG